MPEQNLEGYATVNSLAHYRFQKIPDDENSSDDLAVSPVTGIFVHESTDVWTICFDNGAEGLDTLGVTGSHPIYSLDANGWVFASTLTTGNQVLTKSGHTTVTSVKKQPGSQKVYNLEVRDLHNFLVGRDGVVVHNSCLDDFFGMLFGEFTRKPVPGKKWVDFAKESGLGKGVDDLKELVQLENLGKNLGERMVHLHKAKNGAPFPGIDAFTNKGVPVSLKKVTSKKQGALGKNIKAIGERATAANATAEFNGSMKDIIGMITAHNFTVQQIKDKIISVRALHPLDSKIVKKYFVEGKDGSGWIEF